MNEEQIFTDAEREFIASACRREIDDFETDGGVLDYYESAKTILTKLSL